MKEDWRLQLINTYDINHAAVEITAPTTKQRVANSNKANGCSKLDELDFCAVVRAAGSFCIGRADGVADATPESIGRDAAHCVATARSINSCQIAASPR